MFKLIVPEDITTYPQLKAENARECIFHLFTVFWLRVPECIEGADIAEDRTFRFVGIWQCREKYWEAS
jgi:hypothetical protein